MPSNLQDLQVAEFYSSLADVMLAQYENFNRLIGPNPHQTHSGTLCEVLLRNTLRPFFPPDYALDKGFVFGRRKEGDDTQESPEIDILIHRTGAPPMFRLDDLVIAHGESVYGVIQVKKTLDDGPFKKGIENTFTAMKHIAAVSPFPQDVLVKCCSMVVGFNKGLPGKQSLTTGLQDAIGSELPTDNDMTALMMPNLIGSIQDGFYVKNFSRKEAWYWKHPSVLNNKNYFVQVMLHLFSVTIFQGMPMYPVDIPPELAGTREVLVYRDKSLPPLTTE